MGTADLHPPDLLREAYNHVALYGGKDSSAMPQYSGKDIHFTEDTSARSDGHVDSSGGEESYVEDSEKDGSNDDCEEEGNYTTLETVGTKYSESNDYRNSSQDVNVIEFKDTVHATSYHFQSVPTYYHGEGDVHTYPTGVVHTTYKNEKYEHEEEINGNDGYCYQPYGSYPTGHVIQKSRDVPYGFGMLPSPSTSVQHQNVSNGWGGFGPQSQSSSSEKAGVFLCNRELWAKFHTHITEMIVTKQGR